MNNQVKIPGTDEAWETEQLGCDESCIGHLSAAESASDSDAIDAALELKSISIRLENDLIDEFKMIARYNNIGYQPLMRQALHRFAKAELKKMAADALASQEESRTVSMRKKAA
jgi:predicted transcriptional regulator